MAWVAAMKAVNAPIQATTMKNGWIRAGLEERAK
jgi:hypothetical protein